MVEDEENIEPRGDNRAWESLQEYLLKEKRRFVINPKEVGNVGRFFNVSLIIL